MALGELIFERLTTYPATAALIATRCYPVLLPQEPTLPAVTYDVRNSNTNEGQVFFTQVVVQVNCWAVTYAGVVPVSEAVKAALRQYTKKEGTPPALISMNDENEADLYDPETGLHGRSVEFMAWVVEAPP